MTSIEWVELEGYPDYVISVEEEPQIRSKNGKRNLGGKPNRNGYIMIRVGPGKIIAKHRLIALQFIPNPEGLPCVDHMNGVRDDNRISNLRWVSYEENSFNKLGRRPDLPYEKRKYNEVDFNDLIFVDRYNSHYFGKNKNKYYFNERKNEFYLDAEHEFRVLETHTNNGSESEFVVMMNNKGKQTNVFFSKFKEQHDIMDDIEDYDDDDNSEEEDDE